MKLNKLYTLACIAVSVTVLGFTRTIMHSKNNASGSDTSTTDTTIRNNPTNATTSSGFDPTLPGGTATSSSTVMNPSTQTDFTVPAVPNTTTSSDYPTTDGQKPSNSYTITTPESTSTT